MKLQTQPLRVESHFPFGKDVGRTDVVCIDPSARLGDAIELMRDHQIGDLVVIERDESGRILPVGMITDRDIALAVGSAPASTSNLTVNDVMTQTVASAHINDDIFAIARKMKEFGVSRMPVIDDDGTLTGIVTAKKLLQVFMTGLNDVIGLSRRQQENERAIQH